MCWQRRIFHPFVSPAHALFLFLFSYFMARRIDMKWNLCMSTLLQNTPLRADEIKKSFYSRAAQNVLTLVPIAFVITRLVSVHL
jgi:hypothetical protein